MRLRRSAWKSGVVLALGVAFVAHRARALTSGGAALAVPIGALVHAGTGWRGSLALVAYVLTTSALGRLPSRTSRPQRRGSRRDRVQVLANGGVPALAAACAIGAPPFALPYVLAAYAGAVATAAADSWSTEVGIRYGGVPRSIVTLRPLPVGASGGASAVGLLATWAGSAMVAVILSIGKPPDTTGGVRGMFAATLLGGVAGSITDSLLGATIQEVRICPACEEETEQDVHACGMPTHVARGMPWCNNDAVNVIAIACGAAMSMAVFAWQVRLRATSGARRRNFGVSSVHGDV